MRPSSALCFAFATLILGGCGSEKPQVRTHPLGEKVPMGPFVYSAFETQWRTQLGDERSPRIPQHRFFLVRMSILNSGPTEVMTPNLSLVDDAGQTYPELSDGEGVPQWIGYLRNLKPADSAQGNLVFDAPPRHYKLRITDETGDRSALIDIPLSFSSESPEVPNPDLRKQ
jgi:hypothetical protein